MATPLALLAEEAAGCLRCDLASSRTQVVFARGDETSRVVFVGEAPGRDEDLQGEPFVGRSGQLLDRLAKEEMGLERHEFYVMNTIKCRPPANRDPKPDELAACSTWFDRQLELLDPSVIVTLGNFATRQLLDTTDGITRLRGATYPFRGAVLVPTFHPAAVLRGGAVPLAQMRADLVRAKDVLAQAPAS